MNIFASLNDKTAVLESLGWDEELLTQLIDFINIQRECFVPTHPTVLLSQIEEYFGSPTRDVMELIMTKEYESIKLTKGGNYEN